MMLTLVSRDNLWFTKWVGNNQFKGFFTSYWLTNTTLVNNQLFAHSAQHYCQGNCGDSNCTIFLLNDGKLSDHFRTGHEGHAR